MFRTWLVLPMSACLLFGVGCSSARVVSWSGSEGVVAIPRNSDVWPSYARTEATKLMVEKCPAGYQIVEEGAAPAGKAVLTTAGPITGRTQMTDDTEYRIKFRSSPVASPSP